MKGSAWLFSALRDVVIGRTFVDGANAATELNNNKQASFIMVGPLFPFVSLSTSTRGKKDREQHAVQPDVGSLTLVKLILPVRLINYRTFFNYFMPCYKYR